MARPVDKANLWIGVLGSLMILGVLFVAEVQLQNAASAKKDQADMFDLEMVCNVPAYFTTADWAYAVSTCTHRMRNLFYAQENETQGGSLYKPFEDTTQRLHVITKDDIIPDFDMKSLPTVLKDDKSKLYCYICAQLALASFSYVAMICISTKSKHVQLKTSKTNVQVREKIGLLGIAYSMIAGIMCISWLTIACLSYIKCGHNQNTKKADINANGVVMCNYAIPRQGDVQRYTVQCTYSIHIPAQIKLIYIAAVGNTTLSVLIFAVWIINGLMVLTSSGGCSDQAIKTSFHGNEKQETDDKDPETAVLEPKMEDGKSDF